MPRDLEITSGRYIGESHPCFIIAEIGQNHQGDVDIAKQLIRVAKESGVDCVKFQKSCLEEKFSASALSRSYDGPHSWGKTYLEHKQHLEFSLQQMRELQRYAEATVGIPFTASAMDWVSAQELDSMDVPFIKVGSGDADNLPLLDQVARTKRAIVLSTGMQELETVKKAYKTVVRHHQGLCLLQCTSAYPTPPCETHLKVIDTYRRTFPLAHVGLSCHEEGNTLSIAAVARGAKILERHITLCRGWRGSDHASSLEPQALTDLVKAVRTVELALGSPLKQLQLSEIPCKQKLGKSLVASRHLPAGTTLNPESDLKVKVSDPPGLSPSLYYEMAGRVTCVVVEADDPLCRGHLLTSPQRRSDYWDEFLSINTS